MINIKDILVLIILFAANLLQAITGFAGTLISMPPVLKLIGAGEAKALLNAIAQISSFMIVCTGFKYINWKEFFKIFGCMVCGMVVGIWIYNRFPLNQLLIFYGVMIMIIALKKMFIKEKKEKTIPIWAGILILLAAGIIHGMFVSGGALLVIYAAAVLKDKQEAKDFDENVLQGLLGQTGVTHSTLRPFGVAEIDGKMIDVCSQGDFIDRDEKVQVVQITGKTVIVKVCEA